MTKPTKYPRLGKADMTKQIVKRCGLDQKYVTLVMDAFIDTLKDTLKSGVEYSLPGIGVITFQDYPPKPAGERWNGFKKTRMYYPAKEGYYRLRFKAERKFAQAVKAGTIYGEGCTSEEWNEWVLQNYPNNPKFAKTSDET